MNSDTVIAIVAITTPFLFTAWVIRTRIRAKERKHDAKDHQESENRQDDWELEQGIRDLEKRIENLEIILRGRNSGKE